MYLEPIPETKTKVLSSIIKKKVQVGADVFTSFTLSLKTPPRWPKGCTRRYVPKDSSDGGGITDFTSGESIPSTPPCTRRCGAPLRASRLPPRWVERGAKLVVFSDTGAWYNGLVGLGYVHRTADHEKQEYVDGEVHINGLEGFWGLSKTNMHAYKGIKKKNWLLYLKEMEWWYNNRRMSFDEMVEKIIEILMTYRRKRFVPY